MKTNVCRECKCIGKPSKGLINIHNIQTQDLSKEFEDKLVYCLKCPNCGHSWIPEKSTREQAIEWWNNLSGLQQTQYCDINTGIVGNIRRRETLTGREIEEIWKNETQQVLDILDTVDTDYAESFERTDRLVDFKMLLKTYENCAKGGIIACDKEAQNLNMFFDKLSTSSSFAHKAHKELNRLNE